MTKAEALQKARDCHEIIDHIRNSQTLGTLLNDLPVDVAYGVVIGALEDRADWWAGLAPRLEN